jgi:hypothetical protein
MQHRKYDGVTIVSRLHLHWLYRYVSSVLLLILQILTQPAKGYTPITTNR